MGIYNNCVVPHLVHLAMRNRRLLPYRKRTISAAEGRILEVGIGSGLNLPLYSAQAREILGLEPAPRLLARARRVAAALSLPATLIEGSAEAIPLEDGCIDTVVTTWTLCTIPAVDHALGEMRRVLRPSGRLLFVEHGLSPDDNVRRWQDWAYRYHQRSSGPFSLVYGHCLLGIARCCASVVDPDVSLTKTP